MNIDELKQRLREQARKAVEEGEDIREEIRRISSEASQNFQEQAEGFAGLAEAVVEGAAEGLRESPAGQVDSVLRQVVDGLGDAMATTAQAVKLMLEEARSSGTTFAREDLDKVSQDFRVVGEMFVDTVERTLKAMGSHLGEQAGSARDHARHSFERVQADLQAAATAAADNLGTLTSQTFQAGAAAVSNAAGVFFSMVGERLKEAGARLKRSGPDEGKKE